MCSYKLNFQKIPRIMWRDQQSINQNFYLASGFSWPAKIWRYSNEILIYSESMGFVRNETEALMLMKHGSYSHPPFYYITILLNLFLNIHFFQAFLTLCLKQLLSTSMDNNNNCRSGWFLFTASKVSQFRICCIFGEAFRPKGASPGIAIG